MAAGRLNPAAEIGPTAVPWWRDWRGERVAIIGAGPSAKKVPIDMLRGRVKTIAISDSYKLAPWADVLYSCDFPWWHLHKGAPDFTGLRLSHDTRACTEFGLHRIFIEKVGSDELLVERPSYVGAGGNSGFQALNLAIQFGVIGIMLIGIDCSIDHGSHWFGRHPMPLANPAHHNIERWRKAFDKAAPAIAALGVDVVNCSPYSSVAAYPKLSIEQALERWGI